MNIYYSKFYHLFSLAPSFWAICVTVQHGKCIFKIGASMRWKSSRYYTGLTTILTVLFSNSPIQYNSQLLTGVCFINWPCLENQCFSFPISYALSLFIFYTMCVLKHGVPSVTEKLQKNVLLKWVFCTGCDKLVCIVYWYTGLTCTQLLWCS